MVFSYRVVRVVVFVSFSVDPGNMSQAKNQQKPGNQSFSILFCAASDGTMSLVETCNCQIVSRTPYPRPQAFSEVPEAKSFRGQHEKGQIAHTELISS